MAAATYGQYSPKALEPNPIETTLAHDAYGQYPAEAQTQLDLYQLQRQTAENQYGAEMAQQHEFAKQQLGQQLYEANLKGLYEAGKTPGMLQIMQAAPQYAGVFGGADQGTIGNVVQQQRETQQATDYEHGASGLKSAVEAGATIPNTGNVPGMRAQGAVPLGDPVAIRSALIAANARIAAASIGAKGAQNAAMMPSAGVVIGYDKLGNEIKSSIPLPPNVAPMTTLEPWLQIQDQVRRRNAEGGGAPTPEQPVTPPATAKKQPMPMSGPGARTNTSLQPQAQTDQGRASADNFQRIPPGSPEGRQLQIKAMQFIDQVGRGNPALAGRMKARGPVIDIGRDPSNGQPVIIGNDKQAYAF